MKQIKKVV